MSTIRLSEDFFFFFLAFPFLSLPVLSWDGETIGQSMTISRFLARKAGLAGKTDVEQAKADAIVDQCVDTFQRNSRKTRSRT